MNLPKPDSGVTGRGGGASDKGTNGSVLKNTDVTEGADSLGADSLGGDDAAMVATLFASASMAASLSALDSSGFCR